MAEFEPKVFLQLSLESAGKNLIAFIRNYREAVNSLVVDTLAILVYGYRYLCCQLPLPAQC